MTSQTTFYFSQLRNRKIVTMQGAVVGKIRDFMVDLTPWGVNANEPVRPRVIGVKVLTPNGTRIFDFTSFELRKYKGNFRVICHDLYELNSQSFPNSLWLRDYILGKQIVDMNDKKLVKVHDVRMVMIPSGTFAIAVDVGYEAWLRWFGLDKSVSQLFEKLGISFEDDLVLWDDIAAVDQSHHNLRLAKPESKLNTLHPSDLADIIEDLDKATRTYIFSTLDEEKAADVLEELKPEAQVQLVESLPKEKVADVLDKMPADEVADILDGLEDSKAEELLNEMEKEASEEVRELLEYPDKAVGSIMSTDFMTFNHRMTVEEVLNSIRKERPEPSFIHSILIVDDKDKFLSAISLGEILVLDIKLELRQIMNRNPVTVFDDDDIDTLAELVSKYNLLAVPVINRMQELEGVVLIEDIVHDLMGKRQTR
jgi:CBS domain-containing protein/sporulation protein YlmC with PRC-barrel domain